MTRKEPSFYTPTEEDIISSLQHRTSRTRDDCITALRYSDWNQDNAQTYLEYRLPATMEERVVKLEAMVARLTHLVNLLMPDKSDDI